MSLPAAPKDISEKPAAGSVTAPVNKADKDADVERKIRLYGVIAAFRQGRMPTNKQIDQTLEYVLHHSPVNQSELSPDGKKLIQDVKEIVQTARDMVKEKNHDELFQKFVWHTRDAAATAPGKEDAQGILKGKAENGGPSENHDEEAVRHLRTLLSLILTNSEVRKLLSDFSLIGRDLLARTAAHAAKSLAPDQAALAGVDESGPQDEFITEGGRKTGPNETPVLEARVPGTDTKMKQHPKDDEGVVRDEGLNGQERGVRDVKDEGLSRANDLKQNAKETGRDELNGVHDTAVNGDEADAEAKKQGIMHRMKGVRDGFTDRIPQQHRDRATNNLEKGKKFLAEEYFPEERRDQFIYRGKKVVIECQKHSDYQESITWLLSYLEDYVQHTHSAATASKEESRSRFSGDPKLQTAFGELRELLERFANGQSLGTVVDAGNALIDDAKRDEGLRTWFKSVDAWLRQVLLEPGYVLEDGCNERGKELRESGRKYYDGTYKGHFDRLFESVGNWFKAMGEDPLNDRFGQDWARLTKDLLFDEEGGLKFKKHLWSDVRKVIIPGLIDNVGYFPIPRIEYTDDALDLVVENLTLSGRNLFPNIISLEAHNFVKFSPHKSINDQSSHKFTLTFAQMQADMKDVAFYFRKKSGIPKMNDSGLADVILGGEGLTVTVVLVSAGKDKTSVFKVQDAHVKVDTLKFSIRDSKHDLLYKTIKPLATGLVKKQIQKAIRDAIVTGMEYVDGQLVSVRDRMENARKEGEQGGKKGLADYFKRTQEEASVKSKEASMTPSSKHSQFKVVSNKRDSILASEGHPAGWVNRTAEKDELAVKGEEWRSEAFTIV